MKMYTHAWLAFMAMKRLQYVDFKDALDAKADRGKVARLKADAKSLLKWFKDYRDYVIEGAWYPDHVICDNATSHIVKYKPDLAAIEKMEAEEAADPALKKDPNRKKAFKVLPDTIKMYGPGQKSRLFERPFDIPEGNGADRCEAISHDIVDSLKVVRNEEKGTPIAPSNNYIAMRFFIQSHYIADLHMPLHCDHRPFSEGKALHAKIEEKWEKAIESLYKIDKDNNRFFYDPDGYPLKAERNEKKGKKDSLETVILELEEEAVTRTYSHGWGTKNKSTWDYMSAISAFSYLRAYEMIPETVSAEDAKKISWTEFSQMKGGLEFDRYSKEILGDAIDSIARIWLHVWARYRDWYMPYKKEPEKWRAIADEEAAKAKAKAEAAAAV